MIIQANQMQAIIDILNDNRNDIFDIDYFETELLKDKKLIYAWHQIFDKLDVVIADDFVDNLVEEPNKSDVKLSIIIDTINAQCISYRTTSICYDNKYIYNGYVLPLTYQDVANLIKKEMDLCQAN